MKKEEDKKALEQASEYSFIKEKIKERPKSKKQIAVQCGCVIAGAVVFGMVASVVIAVMTPYLEGMLYAKESRAVVTIPKDELPQTGKVTVTPTLTPTPEPVVNVVEKELGAKDYVSLSGKIYHLADEVKDSLVTVVGVSSNVDWLNNPYENEGQASGVIVADNGKEILVLTDKKVIENVEEINVILGNGESIPAVQKKYDGNTELVILAVERKNISAEELEKIQTVTLGNSKMLNLGTPVLAVGSPLGTTDSVLSGNVTSLKTMSDTEDVGYPLIRTDMLGSSGGNGILINFDGEAVGIFTRSLSGVSENGTITAYAISELKGIIERLSNNLGIAYLGVKCREVTKEDEEKYNMPRGVGITNVSMDSPAMKSGIQSGDIIVGIEDESVSTQREFENAISNCEPEQLISIKVMRLGAEGYVELKFDVTLSVMP